MPAYPLRPVDDSFLDEAPIVVRSTVGLDATPSQVWAALGSEEMWGWLPIIDNLEWRSPEPRAAGCIRRLRLGKVLTVDEEFYRWDVDRRATFRVVGQSRRMLDGLIEDFVLTPTAKGTDLTWTMAVSPIKGRGLPLSPLGKLLAPGNTVAISGIRKLLR